LKGRCINQGEERKQRKEKEKKKMKKKRKGHRDDLNAIVKCSVWSLNNLTCVA
jgi:hypothetical protein